MRILTPLMLRQLTTNYSTHFLTTHLMRWRSVVLHPRLLAFHLPTVRFPLEFQMWGYPVLLLLLINVKKIQIVIDNNGVQPINRFQINGYTERVPAFGL